MKSKFLLAFMIVLVGLSVNAATIVDINANDNWHPTTALVYSPYLLVKTLEGALSCIP